MPLHGEHGVHRAALEDTASKACKKLDDSNHSGGQVSTNPINGREINHANSARRGKQHQSNDTAASEGRLRTGHASIRATLAPTRSGAQDQPSAQALNSGLQSNTKTHGRGSKVGATSKACQGGLTVKSGRVDKPVGQPQGQASSPPSCSGPATPTQRPLVFRCPVCAKESKHRIAVVVHAVDVEPNNQQWALYLDLADNGGKLLCDITGQPGRWHVRQRRGIQPDPVNLVVNRIVAEISPYDLSALSFAVAENLDQNSNSRQWCIGALTNLRDDGAISINVDGIEDRVVGVIYQMINGERSGSSSSWL